MTQENDPPELSVTFANTRGHLIFFQMQQFWAGRPNQIMLGLGLGWFLLIAYQDARTEGVLFASVKFVLTAVALLALAFVLFLLVMTIGLSSARNRILLTERTVTASDEGLRLTTRWSKTEIAWPGIDRAFASGRFVVLQPSQFSGFVIPRSAFSTPAAADAILAYCRSRVGMSS